MIDAINEDLDDKKKPILEHFEKYIEVDKTLKNELLNRVSVCSFKKGAVIINAKKVSDRSFYILSGLTRTYFLKEGKEINEYFSTKEEWANSPRSWRSGKPDIYYVAAIEDTEVVSISAKDMIFLFEHFPVLNKYGRLSMATLLDHLIERIKSFRFTSAKEKYAHFIETYPNIYHRIPLGMVASYLGIAQETLSRLRSK